MASFYHGIRTAEGKKSKRLQEKTDTTGVKGIHTLVSPETCLQGARGHDQNPVITAKAAYTPFSNWVSYTSIKKQADEHRPVSSQLIERNSLFLAQLACSCFVQDDNNI